MGSCVHDLCLLDAAVTGTSVVSACDLRGKRIAVAYDMIANGGTTSLKPHVAAGLQHAIDSLRKAGCVVDEGLDGMLEVRLQRDPTGGSSSLLLTAASPLLLLLDAAAAAPGRCCCCRPLLLPALPAPPPQLPNGYLAAADGSWPIPAAVD